MENQDVNNTTNNQPQTPPVQTPQTPPVQTPQTPPVQTPEGDGGSVGPIVGSVIVIIIIIIGGLYFWGQKLSTDKTADEIRAEEDSLLANLETVGQSDELEDIENDLDATDLDNLDDDLDNIEVEL
jgi:uncharacterized protein HemX